MKLQQRPSNHKLVGTLNSCMFCAIARWFGIEIDNYSWDKCRFFCLLPIILDWVAVTEWRSALWRRHGFKSPLGRYFSVPRWWLQIIVKLHSRSFIVLRYYNFTVIFHHPECSFTRKVDMQITISLRSVQDALSPMMHRYGNWWDSLAEHTLRNIQGTVYSNIMHENSPNNTIKEGYADYLFYNSPPSNARCTAHQWGAV